MGQVTAARMLAAIGRLLIAAGVIILLFAGYQLWGTSLQEQQAQDALSDEFARSLDRLGPGELQGIIDGAAAAATTTAPSTTVPAVPTTPPPATTVPAVSTDLLYPDNGEPVARLQIPSIGVDKIVVEGTDTEDLRRGPGRYPETPLPGQAGNAAIAGHRTTYGAPFHDLDKLQPGAKINVTTVLGQVTYTVAGSLIVAPEQVEVVSDYGDNRLTLTACHPKYSAAQRIIVWATLDGEPMPAVPRPGDQRTVAQSTPTLPDETAGAPAPTTTPVTTVPAPTTTAAGVPTTAVAGGAEAGAAAEANGSTIGTAAGLAGDPAAWPPAILWGAICLAVAALAWFGANLWERHAGGQRLVRAGAYALASPVFLVCLYFCFLNVDRLLPAY